VKRIAAPEFGLIPRDLLDQATWGRLKQVDAQQPRSRPVLDWTRSDCVKVRNYVGVVQCRGLSLELLPKVTGPEGATVLSESSGDVWLTAQRNLLYMLIIAGKIPFQERDLASLRNTRMPLHESIVRLFAQSLQRELRCGVDHAYLEREENLNVIRGKILVGTDARINAVRRDRIFVRYGPFDIDTPLNRILKATCRRLLAQVAAPSTQQLLRECIADLADVSDVHIEASGFAAVHFNRCNERFAPHVGFARQVWLNRSSMPSTGHDETFCLLFPMEVLFQEFVVGKLRRHAQDLGLADRQIISQGRGIGRFLLNAAPDGCGRFRLAPDIAIRTQDKEFAMIIDTKWKVLSADDEDRKNGVNQGDMYQLFAYAHRFRSRRNILLYPRLPGVTSKRYTIPETDYSIGVHFLDVANDLKVNHQETLRELREALLQWPPLR